jgi:Dolichyl-phosphate-mannose-protein mannosyltransferase
MLLMTAWAFAVPIFEAPDEPHHWNHLVFIRENHRLPPFDATYQTGYHPPLYYLLLAPLGVRTVLPPPAIWRDAEGLRIPFPPRFFHNTNADFRDYWPIRIARLLTIVISGLTVWFCYLAGREATGAQMTGILAAGLVAFLPEFSFRGMNVSNDALVTCLAAAAVWLMIRLLKNGFSWKTALAATLTVAAAYHTKVNAGCLAAPLVYAVLMGPASWPTKLRRGLAISAAFIVLIAPWAIRNTVVYGDPVLAGAMRKYYAVLIDPHAITSPYFRGDFPDTMFRSFVGLFGWMNLLSPEWVYTVYGMLALLAAAGLATGLLRRRVDFPVPLLSSAVVIINLAIVVQINLTFRQPQGRYMFPALAAVAVLTAIGLEQLLPRRRSALAGFVLIPLAAVNVYLLTAWVWPAYWPGITPHKNERDLALEPSGITGLRSKAPADDWLTKNSREFVVESDRPEIVTRPDVRGDSFPFLELRIATAQSPQVMTGVVSFTTPDTAAGATNRVPFRWRPSGETQPIIVPMATHAEWRGPIRLLAIEPVGTCACPERVIRLERIRLRGTLR